MAKRIYAIDFIRAPELGDSEEKSALELAQLEREIEEKEKTHFQGNSGNSRKKQKKGKGHEGEWEQRAKEQMEKEAKKGKEGSGELGREGEGEKGQEGEGEGEKGEREEKKGEFQRIENQSPSGSEAGSDFEDESEIESESGDESKEFIRDQNERLAALDLEMGPPKSKRQKEKEQQWKEQEEKKKRKRKEKEKQKQKEKQKERENESGKERENEKKGEKERRKEKEKMLGRSKSEGYKLSMAEKKALKFSDSPPQKSQFKKFSPLTDFMLMMPTTKKSKWKIREYFRLDKDALMYATQLSCGVLLASLFWVYKDFLVGTGGVWVAISLIIVLEKPMGMSLMKSIQRIIGTIIGGAIGVAMVVSIGHTGPNCFHCTYKTPLYLLSVFLFSFFFSYFRGIIAKHSYLFTLATLSLVLVMDGEISTKLPSESSIADVYWKRMAAVTIGISLAFLVSTFVFPNRASAKLRKKLYEIIETDFVEMFNGIIDLFIDETVIRRSRSLNFRSFLSENDRKMRSPPKDQSERERDSPPSPFPGDQGFQEESEMISVMVDPMKEGEGRKGEEERKGEGERFFDFDEGIKSKLEHLQLVETAENMENQLSKISNKITECHDLLKLCGGEPIVKPNWRPAFLPQQKYKEIITCVRAVFNLGIPLIYLLSFDSGNPSSDAYDLLLDFYEKELRAAKYQIETVFTTIAEFLKTGGEEEHRFAIEAVRHFTTVVRDIDKKRELLNRDEWKFPVEEVQAFYQIRLCMHLFVGKSRKLIDSIKNLNFRHGQYYD